MPVSLVGGQDSPGAADTRPVRRYPPPGVRARAPHDTGARVGTLLPFHARRPRARNEPTRAEDGGLVRLGER